MTPDTQNTGSSVKDAVINLTMELEEENIRSYLKLKNRITPQLTSEHLYPALEKLYTFYKEEEILRILENLHRKGLLHREISINLAACPECGSINHHTSLTCSCGGKDLRKIQLVKHRSCGFIGLKRNISQDNTLSCPRCQIFTKDSNDFKPLAIIFSCEKCGESHTTLTLQHKCKDCGKEFTIQESALKKLYEYSNPKREEETKDSEAHAQRENAFPNPEILQEILAEKTPVQKHAKLPESHLLVLTDKKNGFQTLLKIIEEIKHKKIRVTYTNYEKIKKQLTRNYNLILIEHDPHKYSMKALLEEIQIWGIETPVIVYGENIPESKKLEELGVAAIIDQEGDGLEMLSHYL